MMVRAEAVAGDHAAGLVDPTCSESLRLSGSSDAAEPQDPARWRGQFACWSGLEHERLMPESLHWSNLPGPPIEVKPEPGDESQRFYDALSDRHEADRSCVHRKVTATIVGRFDHEACKFIWVRADPTAQPRIFGAGFGPNHATLSRLKPQSIKDVALGPENDCWRKAEMKRNPAGPR
ncbi:MAG: hypothetical protein IPP47_19705 [Bryobacterales bacterium]|nr:hypothetical protein [Bryobacterales bacterium]